MSTAHPKNESMLISISLTDTKQDEGHLRRNQRRQRHQLESG